MARPVEDAVLQVEARNRLFLAVRSQPGIHLSEAARACGLSVTHARYHLDQLVKADLVSADAQEGLVRYYAREGGAGLRHDVAGRQEKPMLDALRRRACLHLVLLLLPGPCALAELAERFGKTRPTVLFHIDRLVARGLVERRGATQADRTFALRDPDAILRLLVRFPPPRPLVASFESLWDGLALPSAPQGRTGGRPQEDSPGTAGMPPPEPASDRTPLGTRLSLWLLGLRFTALLRSHRLNRGHGPPTRT